MPLSSQQNAHRKRIDGVERDVVGGTSETIETEALFIFRGASTDTHFLAVKTSSELCLDVVSDPGLASSSLHASQGTVHRKPVLRIQFSAFPRCLSKMEEQDD